MEMTAIGRRYVEKWFWTLDELAEAVGATPDRTEALIAAGCAPGPIYVLTGRDGWWSALGAGEGMPPGEAWYSPGAAWGLRRAVLMTREGASAEAAAAAIRERFIRDFVAALALVEDAGDGFPGCFVDGQVDRRAAVDAAVVEWSAWLGGGYGVCLRVFTGWTCVAKESLAAAMKRALADGEGDPAILLDQAEMLAGLILPFAPWQRPVGTPGRTIDRLLEEQSLGRERPYD